MIKTISYLYGMTLDQLRAFLKVADLLNMTQAAQALNLTQPAISAAIAALENRYAAPLFHRIGRHLELTDTGRAFLPEAQAVIRRADSARRLLQELAGLQQGEVRLYASQTVASYWLPRRMAQFAAAHDNISLPLTVGNSTQAVAAVVAGDANLGFVEGLVEDPCLHQRTVGGDQLGLYAAPGHPLAGRLLCKQDLQAALWVLREPGSGTRDHFAASLGKFDLSLSDLSIRLQLPSNGAVLGAAEAGRLVAVVSSLAAAARLQAGTIVALDCPLPQRAFRLITHRERHLSPAAQAFVQAVQGE
jgi:DNA-binding transcriptional LysR family regulator